MEGLWSSDITSMAYDVFHAQDYSTIEMLRVRWLPFVFSDMTLLHATILVGVSFFRSHPGPRTDAIDVLQLKGMTISAINETLHDPVRAVSDQVIAAVLSIAQYEAFWGERQAFDFHMGAVQHMIQMRGGLIGIRSSVHGLLEKFVSSVDYHSSRTAGTDRVVGSTTSSSYSDDPALSLGAGSADTSRSSSQQRV